MAQSKSTIIVASGTSSPTIVKWTSLASGANNSYIDVGNSDASKLFILVGNNASTKVSATCGMIYIGCSDSAATGSSLSYPYSAAKLYRMRVDATRVSDTDAEFDTTGVGAQFHIIGPIETARFKSSQGYIKICKAKSAGDAGNIYIAPILLK